MLQSSVRSVRCLVPTIAVGTLDRRSSVVLVSVGRTGFLFLLEKKLPSRGFEAKAVPAQPPESCHPTGFIAIILRGLVRDGDRIDITGTGTDQGHIFGKESEHTTMDALLQEEGLPRRDRRGRKRSSAALSDLELDGDGEKKQDVQPERDESEESAPSRRYVDQTVVDEELEDGTKGRNFEYRDHTADIQLHAWGKNMTEAFENVGLAMFNYMTPLSGVKVDPSKEKTYKMQAHDMQSLLFAFLDELLFIFNTEFFVCKELRIVKFDRETWEIEAQGLGETFSPETHAMGTEIKAITYSAMQANEDEERAEVYVIVDI